MNPSGESEPETPGFRSPWRVLARFFEKSRDLWKAKYKSLQQQIKGLRTEVRDLRRSRDRWRAKAETLEQQAKELRSQGQRPAKPSPPAPSQPSPSIPTRPSN